jgi:hypothetical protein
MRALLAQARHQLSGLEELRKKAAEKTSRAARLLDETVTADKLHQFRQQIADTAQKHNCRIRKLKIDSVRTRAWAKGDDPFDPSAGQARKINPAYLLNVQPVTLSVSGNLANVKELLSEVHNKTWLFRANTLAFYPSQEDRKDVILDCELLLISLTKAPDPSAVASNGTAAVHPRDIRPAKFD